PKLTANKGSVTVEVNGLPNQRYQVEFFGNQNTVSKEAEQYLGTITVATDTEGKAKANWKPTVKVASITANVTDRFGATSELGFVQVK
ncbi:3-dehydroshikimate dehydratase, partial [Acinetobacter baumannii]